MGYSIAKPEEYLCITGMGIRGLRICKRAYVWPFQKCQKFSIQPQDYPLNLQAMTREKLQFLLPVVFTVGPDVNNRGRNFPEQDQVREEEFREDPDDSLVKYAMLLANSTDNQHIDNIIKGIIEGETRVIVSSMSMEEIFTEREQFKSRVSKNIAEELGQFGLKIYNANVKELRDAPGSSYFDSLARKAHEGAINQARVDVAEAQRTGNVGEAQRVGEQNREIAKINAETAVQKTIRDSEKAKAEAQLATAKTGYDRDVTIAKIEATRKTEQRDEELRKTVEVKRAETELERLRASDVVKATIAREAKQQAADAKNYEEQARSNAALYSEQKSADANAYREKVAAEAKAFRVKTEADANYHAAAKEAEALLVRQQKEAAGLAAMAQAYGQLAQSLGGPAGLIQYMMIEKGVYTDLARANADAVRGMSPKMTIWNTGNPGGEGSGGSGMGGIDSIRNMYQMLPPLMTTINEQTGVTLPEWQFGKLGEQISQRELTGKKAINGLNNLN